MNLDKKFRAPLILIVDDSSLNRKLLNVLLQNYGYKTLQAENGRQARDLAARNNPDLILLDVMMPVEDGFDTCKALKKNAATKDIPIIFISALNDTESIVKGLELGGVDYMGKPFARTEVLARIRVHLELKFAKERLIEAQVQRFAEIKEAQESFLVDSRSHPEARFDYIFRPVLEAGGDFLDVIRVSENTYVYIVADISGHNLGTAYITSALKVLFDQNINPYTPVEEGIRMINAVLNKILQPTQHLTAAFLAIDRSQNQAVLYNAGHLPVIYFSRKENKAFIMEAQGDILGPFEQFEFIPARRTIEPGDRFFLFTDGLVEVFGENYRTRNQGIQSIMDCIPDSADNTLEEALKHVFDCVCPRKELLQDDVILLGAQV
ncbi:MAG: SpoIIE family protein phosphatase [Desulfonatronovibrio sp.]